jgi:hypothetical protein
MSMHRKWRRLLSGWLPTRSIGRIGRTQIRRYTRLCLGMRTGMCGGDSWRKAILRRPWHSPR